MAEVVRKPSLSPSKIATYLACPVKYRWTYIDPRGKMFLRSKAYYSFGASLHFVLQRFHDSDDAGVTTASQATAKLEESWISAGYSSPEEAAEALAEGRELITQYVEAYQARAATARTLHVEKQLRDDFGSFVLIGRIDRIDEHEDGTLEIVDYKSGWDETTIEELRDDLAMNCYQLLVRSKMPGRRVLSTIVALRSNHHATYEPSHEELALFKRDLESLGIEIIERNYDELRPTSKPICFDCDFLPLCSRDEEFAESLRALKTVE